MTNHYYGLRIMRYVNHLNFDIVQIQLNECHLRIEKALNSNYQKI